MKIELVETDDIATLCNLGQLYQYDFSEFVDEDVGADGHFAFIPIDEYYASERFERYVIKVDGKLVGFAIVSFGDAFRNPAERVWWIDEFFVMRKYRRAGVGENVARELFASRPGTWEVGQVETNTGAQTFWRTVIGRYTGGDFEEIHMDDEHWKGPVQYFTSA